MREQIRRLIEISRYSNYLLNQLSAKQASAPVGKLQIIRKNGRVNFYQYFDAKTPQKYLNKSQAPLISALAQKKYDLQAFNVIKSRKEVLDQCITKLKNADQKYNLAKIYEDFPQELKHLITPIPTYDEAYARRWQAVIHEKPNIKIKPTFKTKRGEFVRSKSELIIADKLYEANIPYHYEAALEVNNRIISYPDFLVLNVRTKKEYFWEHFGRMSDAEYLQKTLGKIERYANYGVIQGVNFIATFESQDYSVSTLHLDKIIKTLLK